jgi:hypothetical protein
MDEMPNNAKSIGIVIGLIAIFSISVLLVNGCGSGQPTLQDLNDNNIRRLHSTYKMFMNRHELKGPESEEELKDFLTNNNTAKALLKRMGIESDSIDEIFVSERDGQPFKVRWGVKGIEDHAIIFEAEGIGGKRMVAFTRTRELDADEYEGYWSGELKGQKPGQQIDRRNDPELN